MTLSTVLVVDDEERIRTLVTRTLTAEGHSVDTAGDGVVALDRLAGRGSTWCCSTWSCRGATA